ncbi:hypothetical protein D3C87_1827220 [compost metagenome]
MAVGAGPLRRPRIAKAETTTLGAYSALIGISKVGFSDFTSTIFESITPSRSMVSKTLEVLNGVLS